MAPKFEKSLFQIYRSDSSVTGLVCLEVGMLDMVAIIRDEIVRFLCRQYSLSMVVKEGPKDSILSADSLIWLFEVKNKSYAEDFLASAKPGFFDQIFKTNAYRLYLVESRKFDSVLVGRVETSHDFPGLIVSLKNEYQIDLHACLTQATRDLSLELAETTSLSPISNLLSSNKLYRN